MSDAPTIYECRQNSQEWHGRRIKVATASQFHRLITPVQQKPAAAAWSYFCEKYAENTLGGPCKADLGGKFVRRGHDCEPRARAAYELERGIEVRCVGGVMNAEETAWCSPDGLVGDDGGLELKILSAENHAELVLASRRAGFLEAWDALHTGKPPKHAGTPSLSASHRLQIQGSLWVTGRIWWDAAAWNPGMAMVIERVERDEPLIEKLAAAVAAFDKQLDTALREDGYREPQ